MRVQEDLLRISSLRLALSVLVLCSVAAVSAQTASNASDSGVVLKANARTVLVDVVVTQGNGEPVRALGRQEFQVLEDGKPQAVDFFEEHKGVTLPANGLPALPKMPPGIYTNVPPAPEDDAVNVLLLDTLNTPMEMFPYARDEVRKYLQNVKPGTRLAIITLTDKLKFVQGFTTDTGLLAAAVSNQTKGGVSQSLISSSEVAANQENVGFLNSESAAGAAPAGTATSVGGSTMAAQDIADAFSSYQNFKTANRTRMTLEAISGIARYLAAVPSRKNLIWFAGDFPIVIFPKFDQRMEAQDNVISIKEIQKTADLLTAARVAVYPVFASGMMTEDILTAANRSPSSALNPTRMSSMSNMDNYIASSGDRGALIAGMNQIASDTGGKAIYNTNDLNTATLHAVSDGSQYYTLAYSPTNKKLDGHYRKVEVKINDGKYKLSYRHGYNADEDSALPAQPRTPEDPLRMQMAHGFPDATELLFGARVLPASPQPEPGAKHAGKNANLSGPFTRYSIDMMVRWNNIAFTPTPEGIRRGKLEVSLIAWDAAGKSQNWNSGTLGMAIKPDLWDAIQKSGVPAHMEVDLPNTARFLKLGVFDWGSGKAGTLEIPLHPGTANASPAAAQPAAKP